MIAVVDYGAGNVFSILHVCRHLGVEAELTADPAKILAASHVIVPGQGAFKQAMTALQERGLVDVLKSVMQQGTPFLGICLGFQILFEGSDEHGGCEGLGVFSGRLKRIDAQGQCVPHMGWNQCERTSLPMFAGISSDDYVYFVHSYCVSQTNNEHVSAWANYGQRFVAAMVKNNIWATQFHPEKSSAVGQRLLKNFLESH